VIEEPGGGATIPPTMPPMTWRTIGLIGAGLNVVGALLLVVVISPGRKRYEHMFGAHLEGNPPMKRFVRDQTRADALVLLETTLQLLAALFAR
jgi:hypothetical protein